MKNTKNAITVSNTLINSIVDYFKSNYCENRPGVFKTLAIQIACYLMYKNVTVKIVNNDGEVDYVVKDFLPGTLLYGGLVSNRKYVGKKTAEIAKMIEKEFNDHINHYYDAQSVADIIIDYICDKHNCDRNKERLYA